MRATKFILFFCALFFLIVGSYLRITHSSTKGYYKSKYDTGTPNGGFVYTEINGDFVLFLAALCFIALFFLIKGRKKINL